MYFSLKKNAIIGCLHFFYNLGYLIYFYVLCTENKQNSGPKAGLPLKYDPVSYLTTHQHSSKSSSLGDYNKFEVNYTEQNLCILNTILPSLVF